MSLSNVISTVISILALALSILAYVRGEQIKKREDLRSFLSRTLHLSERVGNELLMISVYFTETASDPEIAKRVHDIGVMKYIEELIEIDSTSPRWRKERFYDQFRALVMDLRSLEIQCIALIREKYIASEAELMDLLTDIARDSRSYGEAARNHLTKL